ncbi:MAG: cobalamin B12-binding domain-containing protein [Gammaproteobacteria bacterium]|nr:cobalamin B12-binding domain-containing protein [Gammaproteobacteria bacterium]
MSNGIDIIRQALTAELADSNELRREARQLASGISIGRSAFLDRFEVESEYQYKQQAMQDGRIMYHAHIGMNDTDTTVAALARIHAELDSHEYRLDRAGFAVDRRMGLPPQHRAGAAAETGPMLVNQGDWSALAQTAPVQPHLGDFMIGQPASVANSIEALRIGCTTIGNLSQYFTFEAPGWRDAAATAAQTCQAMQLLAEFRGQGVMLHSYLEDGFGALFRNCASVAAWAMLERYIVEELIGARLTHCIGGLTRDPVKRAGWVLALHDIHQGEQVGSMIYGDTLSFGREFEKNRAVTAEYLLWDILVQLHAPSGHAVLPLPVTEAIRIPSADEITEAQLFGRQVEASARRLYPHVDFSAAEDFADVVCREGRTIYADALSGLEDLGVDIRNPLQLLYVLKKLGPGGFEQLFSIDSQALQSPLTDMFAMSQLMIDEHRPMFLEASFSHRVKGMRLLVASSDVHEHAAGALAQLLGEADAEVIYLGAEQDPADLVAALRQQPADALLLSTHNGMALDYANQLKRLLAAESISLPIIMGGVLNQKVGEQALPVAVVDELRALGMHPAIGLPGLVKLLPRQK